MGKHIRRWGISVATAPKFICNIFFVSFIALYGCAQDATNIKIENGYSPKFGTKILVDTTTIQSGIQTEDFDLAAAFKSYMETALEYYELRDTHNSAEEILSLQCNVLDYEKGSAAKRWLFPSWGASRFSVKCEMKDNALKTVGNLNSNKTVNFGVMGGIGGWKSVVQYDAYDIAAVISEIIPRTAMDVAQPVKAHKDQPTGIESIKIKENDKPPEVTGGISTNQETSDTSVSTPKDSTVTERGLTQKLQELKDAKDQGLITVDEYDKKKADILNKY